MESLAPLLGRWRTVADFPYADMGRVEGVTTFALLLDGAFVLQTSSVEHPAAPNGHCVLAAEGDAYVQHYFDSRGVVRRYAMTLSDGVWTLERPGGPGDFAQAFHAERVSEERWVGAWRRVEDGAWIHDFDLVYEREPLGG